MKPNRFDGAARAGALLCVAIGMATSASAQVPKLLSDWVQTKLTLAQMFAKQGQVTGTGTFSISGMLSAAGKLTYVTCKEHPNIKGNYQATGYFDDGSLAGWVSAEIASKTNGKNLDQRMYNRALIRTSGTANTTFLIDSDVPYSVELRDGIITSQVKMFDMDDLGKPMDQRRLITVNARFDCTGQLH